MSAIAEEAPLVALDEQPASSRSQGIRRVLKVAAVTAAATAAVSAAASSLLGGSSAAELLGGKVTGLATETVTFTYGFVPNLGCSNWSPITLARSNGTSIEECEAACNADEDCMSYNYQLEPCQPGWNVSEGCLLFQGECKPEGNPCWTLNYKFKKSVPS